MKNRLKSGKDTISSGVPRVKASHCQAWNCMLARWTNEPIIRSYYQLHEEFQSNSDDASEAKLAEAPKSASTRLGLQAPQRMAPAHK